MNINDRPLNAKRSGFYLKALPSAILAACLFPAVASSANLLIGADDTDPTYDIGSFEKTTLATGVISGHYPDGSTAIKGWTVNVAAGLNMDITDNSNTGGFITPDPKQMADLADVGGFDRSITSVPISVVPGNRYRLSFIIGNHFVFRSTVGVSMTGGRWSDDAADVTTAAKKTFLSAVSLGTPTNDWRTVTVDFIATATTTQITFSGENPGIPGYPRQVAGYPRADTLGPILGVNSSNGLTVSANPDNYPYPSALAGKPATTTLAEAYPDIYVDMTGDGIPRIPRINFDENIVLDKVSLDLVPTTPNLVVNGSFEATVVDGSGSAVQATNSTFASWKVGNNGSVDVKSAGGTGNAAKASDGANYLDLAGANVGGVGGFMRGITSADITVEAGKTYTLSFDIGSYADNFSTVWVGMTDGTWADTSGSSAGLESGDLSNAKLFFNHVKPIGADSTNWQTVTVNWVAGTTGKTKISIASANPNNNSKLVLGSISQSNPAPLAGTTIVNVAGTYAQNYSDNILLDNVKLQEATGTLTTPGVITVASTVSDAPTFSWAAVPVATSYKLRAINNATGNVASAGTVPATQLGCTTAASVCHYRFPGVFPAASYSIAVQAVSATDTSPWSPSTSFTSTTPTALTFGDNNDSGAPFYGYINDITALRITVGQGDGNFGVNANVTRGQMAAFVIRALEGEPANCTADAFSDVPSGDVYCKYIKRMKDRNITQGKSPTVYGVNDSVTREQMAAFIVRAVDGNPVGAPMPTCTTSDFGDVPTSNTFCGYIKRLAELNVTKGCTAATTGVLANYCPGDTVTRGQMAAFISRAFLGKP